MWLLGLNASTETIQSETASSGATSVTNSGKISRPRLAKKNGDELQTGIRARGLFD